MKFDLYIERKTIYKINKSKIEEQIDYIAQSSQRNANQKFKPSIHDISCQETNNGFLYQARITLTCTQFRDENVVRLRYERLKSIMAKAANSKKWNIKGEEQTILPPVEIVKKEPKPLPELNQNVFNTFFSNIYDRDAHIRIIYDNIKTAINTNFKTRHHILLKGKPSCAKSELFLAFIDWIGDDYIDSIDAGTMTKAGLERYLMTKAKNKTLKPILLIEEIEKTHKDNISCLLQVMDARGKIQRVNANTVRDDDTQEECKIIVWATCNDENALKSTHDGAIWSRFGGNKLDCDRPDRNLMEKILLREVNQLKGNPLWAKVALEFCFDVLQNIPKFKDDYDDPRLARALLAGGDRLLDPEGYLKDFRKACKID